jgi:hypothetical protein
MGSQHFVGYRSSSKHEVRLLRRSIGVLGSRPTLASSRQLERDAAVASQPGFAPIELGRLDQGGVPLHVLDVGRSGALLFQHLVKVGLI